MRLRTIPIALASVTLLAGTTVLVASAPATAVESRGACSDGKARYDFEVDKDDGLYEVSFEVDSNVRGQEWRIRLFQDDKKFYDKVRTTDREGEADVERDRRNTPGKDTFRAKAKNLATGEVCTVQIARG